MIRQVWLVVVFVVVVIFVVVVAVQAEPRNVMLVHGEAAKMEFLKQKINQEFGQPPIIVLVTIATVILLLW